MWNRSPTNGTASSANAARNSNTRTGLGRVGMSGCSRVKQASRPPQQHDRHQRVYDHAGGFGYEDFAERVGKADQHRAEERALDRADAPYHQDDRRDEPDALPQPR